VKIQSLKIAKHKILNQIIQLKGWNNDRLTIDINKPCRTFDCLRFI